MRQSIGNDGCLIYFSSLALYSLEEDWSDLVISENLSERMKNQQTAIWELITTELAYIRTVKVIQDVSFFFLI